MEHLRADDQLLRSRVTTGAAAEDELLSEKEYDLTAMHERSCTAIQATGRTQREIAALMGADLSIPLHKRKPIQPTMRNVTKVAQILGISVGWLLTGKPENDIDLIAIGHRPGLGKSATTGNIDHSTVVQDVTANTITVHNFSGDGALTKSEADIILLLRQMPPQKKIKALSTLLGVAEC